MTPRVSLLALLLGLAVLCAPGHARAQSQGEAAARDVLIALRVLAYDRALATRATGDELTVLIVHAATNEGRADRDRWLAGFRMLPNVKAGGRHVSARAHELAGADDLDAAVARLRPALVIAAGGVSRDIATLRQVTRKRQALSFSLREADVRAGLAAGVVRSDHKHEIVINLDAARGEGIRFSAGLLKLARLVEESRP